MSEPVFKRATPAIDELIEMLDQDIPTRQSGTADRLEIWKKAIEEIRELLSKVDL